jgi:hypothetical protein
MPEIPAKILLGVLRKKSLSEDMVLTDGHYDWRYDFQ